MKQASTWAIFLLALTLVVSCGTRRPGTTQDLTTSDPSSLLIPQTHLGPPIPPIHRIPVPRVNPTTTVLQASAVKTALVSRATSHASVTRIVSTTNIAHFHRVHPTIPPWPALVHLRVLGPRNVHSGKNVSMVGALVITIATPLPTAATAPQMKCVTAKPGPATHFQAYATSVSSAHVIGSAIAATCAST